MRPAFAQDDTPPKEPVPGADEPAPESDAAEPPSPDTQPEPKAAHAPKPQTSAEADAKATPKAATTAAAEKKDRPLRDSLKLTAGPLTFIPVLLIQAQVLPYVGDDAFASQGDPADSEGFRLRRGRIGAEVDITDQARARVSFELGSREDGAARIHDAWLAWVGFPFVQAWGGAMTVPFSRSAIAGSEDQALTERPLAVRSMAPGQQVGLVAHGAIAERAFVYDAGVFNGFSRSDQFYAGYLQNYAPLGNRFEGLAYVARLATEPIGSLSPSIADETHQSPRFGIGASYYYSDGGSRGIHSFGGDALLHAEGFHLLAEALFANVVPKADPTEPTYAVAETKSLGLVGEAGYMIFRDLLGVTARFEYVDSAMGVDDEGDNWIFGGGATVMFFDGMVRTTVEFEHREEMFGLSLANDALIFQAQLAAP
ncbi:MAG TPA: porin [Polyangiaceae bacterium]|nr:porin [Polyangiaceae bacterium]